MEFENDAGREAGFRRSFIIKSNSVALEGTAHGGEEAGP